MSSFSTAIQRYEKSRARKQSHEKHVFYNIFLNLSNFVYGYNHFRILS